MKTKALHRLQVATLALFAALLSLVASYAIFEWLIKYWGWQHKSLTFWADGRAILTALCFYAVVFYTGTRYLKRRLPSNEQMPRWALMLWSLVGVVVLFGCIVAYIAYIVLTLRV